MGSLLNAWRIGVILYTPLVILFILFVPYISVVDSPTYLNNLRDESPRGVGLYEFARTGWVRTVTQTCLASIFFGIGYSSDHLEVQIDIRYSGLGEWVTLEWIDDV